MLLIVIALLAATPACASVINPHWDHSVWETALGSTTFDLITYQDVLSVGSSTSISLGTDGFLLLGTHSPVTHEGCEAPLCSNAWPLPDHSGSGAILFTPTPGWDLAIYLPNAREVIVDIWAGVYRPHWGIPFHNNEPGDPPQAAEVMTMILIGSGLIVFRLLGRWLPRHPAS